MEVAGSAIATRGGKLVDQGGERVGENDVRGAEAELGASVVAMVDVAAGESGYPADLLSEQQDQEGGYPVGGWKGVLVQQASCLLPSMVVGGELGRLCADPGGDLQKWQVSGLDGPRPEGAGAVREPRTSKPGVQVGLPAAGQGAAPAAQMVKKTAGGGEFGARTGGRSRLERGPVEMFAEAS